MNRFLQACELGQLTDVREFLLLTKFHNQDSCEVLNAAYSYRHDRYTPLVLASANGHVKVVKLLIQFGADVTYRSPSGRTRKGTTPIHEAAEGGHSKVIQALLERNGNPNQAIGYVQVTPLFVAASHGHAESVRVLLEAGAVNYQKREVFSIDTPLFIACEYGHENVVRVLLQNSTCNIDDPDSSGRTPLIVAAKHGHLNILRLLLQYKADLNRAENFFSNTALHEAVKRERLDMVQELLAYDAVLQVNHLGETPLCIAIERSNEAIVRTIVQARKYQVLDRDNTYRCRRPLHYACNMVCVGLDIVRLLVDLGAGVNQCDPHYANETPLLVCSRCRSGCGRRCKAPVAEYLVREKQASVHIIDDFGRSPLHRAAQAGCEQMVRVLLSAGAMIDQPDRSGATPLHFAVTGMSSSSSTSTSSTITTTTTTTKPRGNLSIAAILVNEYKAIPDYQDNGGVTPLHIASRNADVEIVNVLLQRQAKTDMTNLEGRTPLHVAIEAGHLDIVRALVHHSSCIDQPDLFGWTPLAIACSRGYVEIVRILVMVSVAGERPNMDHVKVILSQGTS